MASSCSSRASALMSSSRTGKKSEVSSGIWGAGGWHMGASAWMDCRCEIFIYVIYIAFLTVHSGLGLFHFEANLSPGSTQPDQLVIRILEMIIHDRQQARDCTSSSDASGEQAHFGIQKPRTQTWDTRYSSTQAQTTAHPVIMIQAILRDAGTNAAPLLFLTVGVRFGGTAQLLHGLLKPLPWRVTRMACFTLILHYTSVIKRQA